MQKNKRCQRIEIVKILRVVGMIIMRNEFSLKVVKNYYWSDYLASNDVNRIFGQPKIYIWLIFVFFSCDVADLIIGKDGPSNKMSITKKIDTTPFTSNGTWIKEIAQNARRDLFCRCILRMQVKKSAIRGVVLSGKLTGDDRH